MSFEKPLSASLEPLLVIYLQGIAIQNIYLEVGPYSSFDSTTHSEETTCCILHGIFNSRINIKMEEKIYTAEDSSERNTHSEHSSVCFKYLCFLLFTPHYNFAVDKNDKIFFLLNLFFI